MSYFLRVLLLFVFTLSSYHAFSSSKKYPYEQLNLSLTASEQKVIDEMQQTTTNIASFASGSKNKFIFNNISQAFGFKFTYISYNNFPNALNSVIKGDTKLISNVSHSTDREKIIAFSEANDIEAAYLFANDYNITNNMVDVRIGVEKDTLWKKIIQENFLHAEIVEFVSIADMFELFETDKVDAILAGDEFYEKLVLAGKYPVNVADKLNLITYIAGTKYETEVLLSIISKYIKTASFRKALLAFNNNNYKQTNVKYLSNLLTQVTPYFDINKVYKIALSGNPPFVIYKKGKYSGLFPDLLHKVAEYIGIKYVIVNKYNDSWYDLYQKFLDGSIDILLPIGISSERQKNMYFSQPFLKEKQVFVKRYNYDTYYKNLGDLIFEKIGVIKGSMAEDYLFNIFSKKNIKEYHSNIALIQALKNDEVDYISMREIAFLQYVNETKDFSIKIDDNVFVFNDNLSVAFQYNETGKALSNLFSVAYRLVNTNEMINKYVKTINYEKYYEQQSMFVLISFVILLIIIIATSLIILRLRAITRTDSLCKTLNWYALNADYSDGIKDKILICFDLDNFKEINDVYGHYVGDEILKHFASNYNAKSCKMYRLSSDIFIVVTNAETKYNVINQYVVPFLKYKIQLNNIGITYHITIKSSILPTKYCDGDFDQCLSILDMAMLEAKRQSINPLFINRDKFNDYLLQLEFRKKLEKAIIDKDIFAHFQPIIDINTNKIIAVETLTRWMVDDRYVPVDKYLIAAKILKLESEIDKISLEWAVQCYRTERAHLLSFKISVNASDQTLVKIGNCDLKLTDYQIPKEFLRIEILEDIIIDKRCMEYVTKIADDGYSIAIDDFGAGNTSLKYVREPKFQMIKIDRSLVPTDFSLESNTTVIKSQIDMLIELKKDIVVEGVETKEQMEYLKSIGVTKIQGYFYAKPMPLHELIPFIKAFES